MPSLPPRTRPEACAEKARRDDMTGMLNRESFFAVLDSTRRRSDRGALLIIDADHFKSINDCHGHLDRRQRAAGDRRARSVAACVPATYSAASAARSLQLFCAAPPTRKPCRSPSGSGARSSRSVSGRTGERAAHRQYRRYRLRAGGECFRTDARGGQAALRSQAARPQPRRPRTVSSRGLRKA